MELWEELLDDLSDEEMLGGVSAICDLLKSKCYKLLEEIKEILNDDALDDVSCFMRTRKIVRAYESVGSNGGTRHDFS